MRQVKTVIRRLAPLPALAAAVLLSGCGGSSESRPRVPASYTLTLIPAPAGEQYQAVVGMNSQGTVLGASYGGFPSWHAFLFSGGQSQEISAVPAGDVLSYPLAISDAGYVLSDGQAAVGLQPVGPFLWRAGQTTDLRQQPGLSATEGVQAVTLDAAGQVLGTGYDSVSQESFLALYARGRWTRSASPAGFAPVTLNPSGDIVGVVRSATGGLRESLTRAALLRRGALLDLGVPPGAPGSLPVGISDAVLVAGDAAYPWSGPSAPAARSGQAPGRTRKVGASGSLELPGPLGGPLDNPWVWDSAHGLRPLPLPPGVVSGTAWAVSRRGEIAGTGTDAAGGEHLILWQSEKARDVTALVPGLAQIFQQSSQSADFPGVVAINDSGQILLTTLAYSTPSQAYLLTPRY